MLVFLPRKCFNLSLEQFKGNNHVFFCRKFNLLGPSKSVEDFYKTFTQNMKLGAFNVINDAGAPFCHSYSPFYQKRPLTSLMTLGALFCIQLILLSYERSDNFLSYLALTNRQTDSRIHREVTLIIWAILKI